MSTNFEAKSRSIGDLLGVNARERIVVPPFQRGYEWGKKHIEKFWEDIIKFEKERGSTNASDVYFLGPIVIMKQGRDTILLLDGQQRLATATILMSVLRDVARALPSNEGVSFADEIQKESIIKEGGNCCLTLGETDELYFKATIQMETQNKLAPTLRTHRNILSAYTNLRKKAETWIGPSNSSAALVLLRSIRQILRSDLVMACIPVESEREAFRIFETLNDRGVRLSVPDLLLNYLMREAKPESDRKDIRSFWSDIVEKMGRKDINRFLRHFWVSRKGDLKSKDLFTAIKEDIEGNSLTSSDFILSCVDECKQYTDLMNCEPDVFGKEGAECVKSIIEGLDCQSAIPFLLSASIKFQRPEFLKASQLALVFIVRFSVIAEMDSSDMETVFFDLAKDIRDKSSTQNPSSIIKDIKETLNSKSPKEEVLRSKIKEFVVPQDYAGYLISRIATKIQTQTKEIKLDISNLEHIYPKRPKESEWGGDVGQKALEPYLWHIGNLTMLGEKINSRASNKEYVVKKELYRASTELEITQKIVAAYDDWNVANIQDRAEKLVNTILEIWNFDNSSRV